MVPSVNQEHPKVSIIMGVYNCAATVAEAVESIRQQTFTEWELIICDDGSTDDTLRLVRDFCSLDSRIVVISNGYNRGLTWTLNRALGLARGQYLARHDGDDVSHPKRLEIQAEFLDRNPDCAIVSAALRLFDDDGYWGRVTNPMWPSWRDFLSGSPFAHAASMMRIAAVRAVGGYRDLPKTLRVEDYDLWFRMYAVGYKGHNLPITLYDVRDDRMAMMRRRFRFRINEARVRLEGYRRLNIRAIYWITAFRPILIGLLPGAVYEQIRRNRHRTLSA